jgi:hypothetical protein
MKNVNISRHLRMTIKIKLIKPGKLTSDVKFPWTSNGTHGIISEVF